MRDAPILRIGLLGRFVVRRGDEEVLSSAFGGRQALTLVRILVIRRGQLVQPVRPGLDQPGIVQGRPDDQDL